MPNRARFQPLGWYRCPLCPDELLFIRLWDVVEHLLDNHAGARVSSVPVLIPQHANQINNQRS